MMLSLDISCRCGKSLRVSEEKRGKRIKCPSCGEVIRVPDGDEAEGEITEAPAPRVRAAKSRTRKGKRKNRSSVVPVVIAGCVGLIVAVGVSAFLFWPRRQQAKPDVIAVPTAIVVSAGGKQAPPATIPPWQPFRHTAGGFSVEAPAALRRIKEREEAGSEFYGIQASGKRPYACYINYLPLPATSTDGKPASHILQVAAKSYGETDQITEQKTLQYQGHEGLEFRRSGPKKRPRRSRLFFHRNALIEFSVMWEKEEASEERDRFWNSIQFTP
jgi:hypothetical protein